MKLHVYQNNFLAGVLDPRAKGRTDADAYQQGMLIGRNVTPHHLGGVRRRFGLEFVAKLPAKITRFDSAFTITVPEGDSDTVVDNANDGDSSTTITAFAVGTQDPFVVVHYDLGSPADVLFADVLGIVSTGSTSDEFEIQYSTDDSIWVTLGAGLEIVDDAVPRDYRRGTGEFVTAQYWRVVKNGGTDMGSVDITINEFNLWTTADEISAVRLIPFEISADDQYLLAITDQCGSVYKDGVFVCYVPLPYASADLAEIDGANLAETLCLVHEDYTPRFVIRELSNLTNFQHEEVPFEHLPQFDFDDTASPTPVSEIQKITFSAGWVQGDTYQLELEGARTASIPYYGDASAEQQSANSSAIASEIQKLFSVEGFSGVSCARTGTREYTVTFADASAATYEIMAGVPLVTNSGSDTIATTRTQAGTARSEDAWGSTRGYPRTVTFFGGRMWFGGVKSLQQSIFGSAVNNILDFLPVEGLDDEPVFITIAGAQLNAITAIYGDRALQVFTKGGEFLFVKDKGAPILPSDAPAPQTKYGSAQLRPVTMDGSTLFVHRTRKAVRDYKFDFQQDAYDSLGVSALAAHLITQVADIAAWNGSQEDEIGLVFIVNGDGTVAVYNSRKETHIQAWTSWDTDGLFKSVGVVQEDVYFAVQRSNGSDADGNYLEILNSECYCDSSVFQTQAADTTVRGLEHLDGVECRVLAQNTIGFLVLENETPSGGEITVEQNVTTVEVGRDFTTAITPMPINGASPKAGQGATITTKNRIANVALKVKDTLGVLINGQQINDRNFDIDDFDTGVVPFSGVLNTEKIYKWDRGDDKLVEITQEDPLPLQILFIDTTIETGD